MFWLILLGKFLLGGAFVVFGVRNLGNLDRLTAAMEKKGLLPQPRTWMMVGVGIQIVGGALVALLGGWLAALGALALVAFLWLAAYLFHDFWAYPKEERYAHQTAWIMNTGLAGAFLMVAGYNLF